MKRFNLNKTEVLIDPNGEPKGKNTLSSRASFLQRKLYEQKIENDPRFRKNKPIDFLYEHILFGRINDSKNGTSLQLKKERLKPIPQKNDITILAVDFVVDAFIEFKKEWLGFLSKGSITRNSPLASLQVKRGWVDPGKAYYDIMLAYYKQLLKYIKNKNKDRMILDFNKFLQIFTEFLDQQTPTFPFTFSSFIISRMGTPHFSGLILDLREDDCGNDIVKFSKVFNDKNFDIFKATAQRHGFNIDKNIPWRLIFNINSIANEELLSKYNITPDTFFIEYFEKTNTYDIELLKVYLTQMYNAYVFDKETFTEPVFTICNNRLNTHIKSVFREREVNIENLDDIIWRFYIFTLSRERNLNLSQEFFEYIVKTASSINNQLDTPAALSYITAKIGAQNNRSQRKERLFRF